MPCHVKLEAVQLETGEQLRKIKYDTYNSGDEIFSISKVKKISRCTKCSFINLPSVVGTINGAF